MAMWNPWRGCPRYSEGCRYCYIHKGDAKRGMDTGHIVRTEKFEAPVARKKNGDYRIKSGQLVYLCFSMDFLLEDADEWRGRCCEIIKERSDLNFLFLTKRIERFLDCIPADWGDGYDNVIVGCTVENQRTADIRLPIFAKLPIKHKKIICQPMILEMNIEPNLDGVELVVGGESGRYAWPLDYDWVLKVRQSCVQKGVAFEFWQLGTHFIKDERHTPSPKKGLYAQARKAGINYQP